MDSSFFKHESAIVEAGAKIGSKTRVWAFTHILPGAVIGEDCNICDHVLIENDVIVGNRVTIKSGVQLWDGIQLEDDVFIGPNATFTNDPFPRSKQHLDEYPRTCIRAGASIGANATVLPGIIIGVNAMIGAGSVITRDVPPNAIVTGNPARILGYVSSTKTQMPPASETTYGESDIFGISGAKLFSFPLIEDLRGKLTFGEYPQHLPFQPKRYFLVFDVPTAEVKGEHAHKKQERILICFRGSCSVMLDDGKNRNEIVLNQPNVGLYIPKMIWAAEYRYSSEAILLVLASDVYDASDYIRDYDEYLKLVS
jgi:acetyltransferase-like isoleucine patch superfamily enzyme/dTDP-4-dehydrorhamnose 3,5-epimerase-like enzyme